MHHTDAHFPYSVFTLPKGIQIEDRSAFLREQTCILTQAGNFSKWELGEHVRFGSPEQVPLVSESILGSGGSGQVEVVVLRDTPPTVHPAFNKRLARKRITRRVRGRHQHGLREFLNEIKILKRLRHQHLVEIIGSYTDPSYAALIMSPVADRDLASYLKIAATDNHKLSSLRTFFGCMAAALAYLHKMHIRHKDIKPSNVLVHGANVLITDFGLSRDCNDTRSTTEGPHNGNTPKYASPEVVDYDRRSFSSDIWSLGCVYLEMLTVLGGHRIDQLEAFMLEHGTHRRQYHANREAVDLWISMLRQIGSRESNNEIFEWVLAMLMPDRELRPSAAILTNEIANAPSSSGRVGELCGICCRGEEEQFDDVEMIDGSPSVAESPLFEPEVEEVKIVRSTENFGESLFFPEMEDDRAIEPDRYRSSAIGSLPTRPAIGGPELHERIIRESLLRLVPRMML